MGIFLKLSLGEYKILSDETIVGPDIPVKSVFGGSGMYDVSPKKLYNPFLSLTMMGMLGYKHLNKDE